MASENKACLWTITVYKNMFWVRQRNVSPWDASFTYLPIIRTTANSIKTASLMDFELTRFYCI